MRIPVRPLFTVRRATGLAVLLGLSALTACLGELAQSRGVVGEAAIDLRGLRPMRQTAADTTNEVQSARFIVYLVSGGTRRVVASRIFTSKDLDVADTDSGTIFKLTFPYNSVDDKFEVEGRGMSAQGDTLYKIGPAAFTMRGANSSGGQAAVAVSAPPVYVGPGVSAAKLVITPRTVATAQGQSTPLTVTLYDASGNPLTSPTFRFDWWSADGAVARFMDGRIGVVTGGERPGSTWLYGYFEPMKLKDSVLATNTVVAAQLKAINGTNQTSGTGTTLPVPITVQVLSSAGFPIAGVQVTFTVTQGGGSVSASTRTSSAPDGVASVLWTLGLTAGPQQVTVSAPGVPSVIVNATAVQLTPNASKSSVTASPSTIQVGSEQAVVTAVLRDDRGSPMPGVAVQFTGPPAAIFTVTTGTTDASGTVTTRVRASAVGAVLITVLAGGQSMGAVTVTATPGPPSAAQSTVVVQPATIRPTVEEATVTVTLRDTDRNAVPNVVVSFTATSGATFTSATATTNSLGVATTRVRAPAVGTVIVTATVGGQAIGTATLTVAQVVSSVSVSVLPAAIQSGGEEATVTAVVKDLAGNPVPNVIVAFSGPAAASFSPATVTTDANGTVTTLVRASVAGTMTITATVVGTQIFGTTTLAVGTRVGVPASISIVSGNNQSVRVGQDFPVPLVVVVRDAAGTPVPGALVDWATSRGEGRRVTDANGQSTAVYALPSTWTAPSGSITVTVTGTSLTATFAFFVVP